MSAEKITFEKANKAVVVLTMRDGVTLTVHLPVVMMSQCVRGSNIPCEIARYLQEGFGGKLASGRSVYYPAHSIEKIEVDCT